MLLGAAAARRACGAARASLPRARLGARARLGSRAPGEPPAPRDAGLAERNAQIALYGLSVVGGTVGVCYASVPLYKVFCQATGFGGTTQRVADDDERVKRLTPAEGGRILRVSFDAQARRRRERRARGVTGR